MIKKRKKNILGKHEPQMWRRKHRIRAANTQNFPSWRPVCQWNATAATLGKLNWTWMSQWIAAALNRTQDKCLRCLRGEKHCAKQLCTYNTDRKQLQRSAFMTHWYERKLELRVSIMHGCILCYTASVYCATLWSSLDDPVTKLATSTEN